ncbi:MAG TPA: glycosyltransferase family 2 protein [Candidatus Peribacteria bacterium]|nr:glycosyltransferase family 2 protein [Candidatus Peribacteria bacterium]
MSPRLSILVPVYNEERTLKQMMEALTGSCPDAELIYVDDGSRDASLKILKDNARPQDVVLTKPNGGKGSAIREGLSKATGAYTTIQDADLEYHPRQIASLLAEAERLGGDVCVFGSRFLTKNPNIYKRYLMGNKFITLALNILFLSRLTDSYTCRKLLPTPLFKKMNIRSSGFELEAEICAKALRSGIPIIELPIDYSPRTIEEGKKINWKDAVKGVWMMLRIRVGL